ncbi:phosphoadenosine phosphosulfate reductase domain-containing protein [Dyadobacter crusticola]|uniref:phosphoadenosine phosphosulfate reductase domain-containing protein n=1 Tax=Dyadobacter crusticola TaxID=292407 RepID=UPI0009FC5300|nr:phosphoadenosine phosphosulfate reductase family protein [Dyadobacter crusticola]
MITDARLLEDSDQLCKRIAKQSGGIGVLSFSMGKDSIAGWIQMQKHFTKVYPVFLYMAPGLEFQRVQIEYYEKTLGIRIQQFPNPSLYRQLNCFMYQSPGNLDAIYDADLYEAGYDDIFSLAKMDLGISQDTYVAVGNRMSDSLNRRTSIIRFGPENKKRKQFFPVFDWTNEEVVNEIRASGIRLPVDYQIWGRSFDGWDFRFLAGLKEHFPGDFQKVKEIFPLIDLELKRYEHYGII